MASGMTCSMVSRSAASRDGSSSTTRMRGRVETGVREFSARRAWNSRRSDSEILWCPPRKKLLLVLPTGHKYDYVCGECGTPVGGKSDNDSRDFYRTIRPQVPTRKSS